MKVCVENDMAATDLHFVNGGPMEITSHNCIITVINFTKKGIPYVDESIVPPYPFTIPSKTEIPSVQISEQSVFPCPPRNTIPSDWTGLPITSTIFL